MLALPNCEITMVRANGAAWWRGWGKVKVVRWSDDIHTAIASGGARTRTEVEVTDGEQRLRVRFETYLQDDSMDENAFKV